MDDADIASLTKASSSTVVVQILRGWLPVVKVYVCFCKPEKNADDATIITSFPEGGTMLLSWFFLITTTPITWSFRSFDIFLFHILFARKVYLFLVSSGGLH